MVGSVGNPLLYLLGIGLGLAAFLDQPIASGVDGLVDYLVFVAPALLATAAVTVATERVHLRSWSASSGTPIFCGMNAAPISGRRSSPGW